jgi:hypothetical protein
MLSAVVLICAVTLQDCTLDNARVVMRLPAESGNAAACLMHAQEMVAQTSIGGELGAEDRVKIACLQASKRPLVR